MDCCMDGWKDGWMDAYSHPECCEVRSCKQILHSGTAEAMTAHAKAGKQNDAMCVCWTHAAYKVHIRARVERQHR